MKVLIVEDQVELAKNIEEYLVKEGFQISVAPDFFTATDKLAAYEYDVVIIDLMLPDGNGMDLLYSLRANRKNIGTLILSAKNSIDDKVRGLDAGADDYLGKPFHLLELASRLKAIYRTRKQESSNVIELDRMLIDTDKKEARVADQKLDLTKKEYEMLLFFANNAKRVLTKQNIAEHLWGDFIDQSDSFDFVYQHIKNLRKKIQKATGTDILETVYGVGYKLKTL
ncbi:DNA-binding response regulator, OmpR family, contains REC and winged-helix (wHTH) domain [Marivirga sericea]|uniref:DNA-binding response regulator, OmpR family, contains REC and winged-helix (WHTH) domain n=1 Tax=Marivirga sericea TaxID=1028 RepID=A0A1X7ICQ1_9BACT|nr:response regulator transcription factor [Marivirga sericea]SMG12439.1 DNA-binding response regulator, OmpR family, contains REC and winged-helix (wHTH) domain [Marivirga sericea]